MPDTRWTLELISHWSCFWKSPFFTTHIGGLRWAIYTGGVHVSVLEFEDHLVCQLLKTPADHYEKMDRYLSMANGKVPPDRPGFDAVLVEYRGNKKKKKYRLENCGSRYDEETKVLHLTFEKSKDRKIKPKSGKGSPSPEWPEVPDYPGKPVEEKKSEW